MSWIHAAACAAAVLAASLAGAAQAAGDITPVTREFGSGTRIAFTDLFGLTAKNEAGVSVDRTDPHAEVTNSTAVMMASVASNPHAIGYISLGSLPKTLKALPIDGVAPSVASIESGSYRLTRPFNLVVRKGESDALTRDFVRFALSDEGQAVVRRRGYVPVAAKGPFKPAPGIRGSITVVGSSSVHPVVDTLREQYLARVPGVKIYLQMSDSSTGIRNVANGVCTLGMSSRSLRGGELSEPIDAITVARDGIAVIVHPDNPVKGLTRTQVRDIYTGKLTALGVRTKSWTSTIAL